VRWELGDEAESLAGPALASKRLAADSWSLLDAPLAVCDRRSVAQR